MSLESVLLILFACFGVTARGTFCFPFQGLCGILWCNSDHIRMQRFMGSSMQVSSTLMIAPTIAVATHSRLQLLVDYVPSHLRCLCFINLGLNKDGT